MKRGLRLFFAIILSLAFIINIFPIGGAAGVKADSADNVTIIDEGGYAPTQNLAVGMKRTFDRPGYKLSIECIISGSSYAFKYTLTAKADGLYTIFRDKDTDGASDKDDWKASNGASIALAEKYYEVKAGQVYTLITGRPFSLAAIGHNETVVNVEIANAKLNGKEFKDESTTNVFDFSIAPTTGMLKITKADSKSFTIETGDDTFTGTWQISYKKKADNAWKSITANNSGTKITGLKAGTDYEIKWKRICNSSYRNKDGNEVSYTLVSSESEVRSIKTGLSDKPAIKSVKISKAKKHKTHTSINMTIKLKKKIKGANGYIIQIGSNDPIYVSGTKTTIKVKTSIKNNMVGKKVPVKISTYTNSDHTGTGAFSKAKKAKVKK